LTPDSVGYNFKCYINTWLTARVGVSRGQGKNFKVLRVYFPRPNVKLFGRFLRVRHQLSLQLTHCPFVLVDPKECFKLLLAWEHLWGHALFGMISLGV